MSLALEQALLDEFASAERAPRTIVWESKPALIVSPSDRLLPRFENAANASAVDGWPVSVRPSGGSAVALGPGVVNLSVITSWRGTAPPLAQGFDLVCAPIIAVLARFGVAATLGPAPGSFCDGKCNVLVNGRKIAGTAQRRTRRGEGGALLAHAMVIVDADPIELTRVVARFYERAGSDKTFAAGAVTSLAQCVAGSTVDNLRATFAGLLGTGSRSS